MASTNARNLHRPSVLGAAGAAAKPAETLPEEREPFSGAADGAAGTDEAGEARPWGERGPFDLVFTVLASLALWGAILLVVRALLF